MKQIISTLLCCQLITFVACVPVKTNSLANQVRVTGSSGVEDCEYIGPVTSEVGNNYQSYRANVEQATNGVRHSAAMKGATHVVLEAATKDNKRVTDPAFGTKKLCDNCVVLTGQAYRCGPKPKQVADLPPTMGAERGSCYPNSTCNDGLVCLSNLCVRPMSPATTPEPVLGDPINSNTGTRDTAPAPPVEIRTLMLGSMDSSMAAKPTLAKWKGHKVTITMKDGRVIEGTLTAFSNSLQMYLADGASVDMLEAQQIVLQDD